MYYAVVLVTHSNGRGESGVYSTKIFRTVRQGTSYWPRFDCAGWQGRHLSFPTLASNKGMVFGFHFGFHFGLGFFGSGPTLPPSRTQAWRLQAHILAPGPVPLPHSIQSFPSRFTPPQAPAIRNLARPSSSFCGCSPPRAVLRWSIFSNKYLSGSSLLFSFCSASWIFSTAVVQARSKLEISVVFLSPPPHGQHNSLQPSHSAVQQRERRMRQAAAELTTIN